MPIDFNWQSRTEDGQWQVLAEARRKKRRRWLPRWVGYLLLVVIAFAATGGYLVVRQRYQQAHQQMVFQIQGVIDLEAEAFSRGDVDLFLAQQDDTDSDWYGLQQERIEADCPSGTSLSARCTPVLPAQVIEVDLRQDVAWVEVLEADPPLRRARFYRQTALGWKHTTPQIAFWGRAIELRYGDLTFRYHERDRPHIDPLVERIAASFYQTCAHINCPEKRTVEVNFAVDPHLPVTAIPPFQDSEWILPSPWLSGLPATGEWSPAQLEALAHAVARGLVTQTLRATPEQQLDPVQRALASEYAAWQATGRRDVAPLLDRIVSNRGEAVLPSLFRWLQDGQQAHTLSALLGRWLDYPATLPSVEYFQELLQTERDALLAGQRDTFMLLQEDEQTLWRSQQEAFYAQAVDVLRSTSVSLPPIQVESVHKGRGRAMVALRDSLVNVRGEAAQSLGQYVFFTLESDGWKHSSIGQALHWRVPFSQVRRAPALPRQETDPGVTWITYASSEPRSHVEAWAASFEAQHPGVGIRVLPMGTVLSFPEESLTDENGLILYLYRLLAYQGALMSDVMDLPVFSELSFYGLARDLTPFLEANSTFAQDFYPGLLRACQQDGKTWALPDRGYPFLIFYDKDAFDEAELPYPQWKWTEADFLEAARQLTVREGHEVQRYGFLNRSGWPIGRAFVEAQTGPLIDSSAGIPMPRLGAPDVVQAVRWYANLASWERVMPDPFEWLDSAGRWGYVGRMWITATQREAAMWVEEASAWRRYRGRENVGVVPFPVSTYPGSPWRLEAHTISAESDHPEESWLWLRYLTAQGTEDQDGNASYLLPARRSVAEASGVWTQWDPEIAEAIDAAMENAWSYRLDTYTLALETAIESIWAGTSVEAALEDAQAQLIGE
jgi:ABC-type glycerol-3-phosphate transport system substrate-binding protein